MYIVTGGAGFIGSHLVKGLNDKGIDEIMIVDDLSDSDKVKNINDLNISDYMDIAQFRDALASGTLPEIKGILHQGACSDTMESDGQYMMANNFTYSKAVFHYAVEKAIPLIYASSASVYGDGRTFIESPEHEEPLNVYAYSKFLFDRYVLSKIDQVNSTVVGLRYFNVYGVREGHKGRMKSIVTQLIKQVRETGIAKLFAGSDGYGDGEHRRDFVYVGDVEKVNFHFLEGSPVQGVFNCGTGNCRSYNDVANAVIAALGTGKKEYIPFPEALKGKYQPFTEADLTKLRAAGYSDEFTSIEAGVQAVAKATA